MRVRSKDKAAIPEFDARRHVGYVETPEYACAFNGQDPGLRDPFGLVWCYWHCELDSAEATRAIEWLMRNILAWLEASRLPFIDCGMKYSIPAR